jgi:hypothetical protein
MEEMRNVHKSFVVKPGEKRPLGQPRSRRKGDIKMDLLEIGLDGVDWTHMVQDRKWSLVNIPSTKGGELLD